MSCSLASELFPRKLVSLTSRQSLPTYPSHKGPPPTPFDRLWTIYCSTPSRDTYAAYFTFISNDANTMIRDRWLLKKQVNKRTKYGTKVPKDRIEARVCKTTCWSRGTICSLYARSFTFTSKTTNSGVQCGYPSTCIYVRISLLYDFYGTLQNISYNL